MCDGLYVQTAKIAVMLSDKSRDICGFDKYKCVIVCNSI